MSQFRNFCLTSFKPEKLNEYLKLDVQYIILGVEVCPETKKKHLQGYCELRGKKTMSSIKSMFEDNGLHIERRKGTQVQAIEYCKKDKEWVESGIKKHQGIRSDLDGIREMAIHEGMRAVVEVGSYQQIKVAEKYLEYNEEPRDWKPEVIWIFGASNTGKSRKARELCENGDTYCKNTGNKWWNGYDGQENVIIDDFRDSWWELTYMLGLLDRYEFRVETKGGMRQFRGKKIIITSIFPPSRCYWKAQEPGIQLLRRIDETVLLGNGQKPEVGGNTETPTPETILTCDENLLELMFDR